MTYKQMMLGELYTVSSGLSKGKAYFGHGYPFLTFKTVFGNTFLPDELSELAETTQKERDSCSIQKGDVFLTRTSENTDELGMSSVALKDYPNATFNGFTKRLRPKKDVEINPIFAGYWFRSAYFRKLVNSMSVMTTRASLNTEMIERLSMPFPDIDTQNAIADTLYPIDARIAANRAINHHLEQMAQAIFKSWFVDFEPWGGVMPEDWRTVAFSTFLTPSVEKSNESTIPLFSVTDTGIHPRCNMFNKNLSKADTKNKIVRETDIVFGMSREVLNWGVLRAPIGGVSSAYNVFAVDSSINSKYLESFIKVHSFYFKDVIRPASREGQGVDKGALMLKTIYLPPDDVLTEYYMIEDSLTMSIHSMEEESTRLAALRDALLPRLMSGELSVAGCGDD